MLYLIERNGHFYFNRRVPETYRTQDKRRWIREALKTQDKRIAIRLSIARNEQLEAYWSTLKQSGKQHTPEQFAALAERSRLLGFPYFPSQEIAKLPVHQILERLFHIEKENYNEAHIEAILGKQEAPVITLDNALDRYFEIEKGKTINKSPNQIRKWQNPRKKAIANFIACVGNKPINEIKRDDTLKFRDWWISRIKNENLVTDSANKDMLFLKTIVCSVVEELKLDLDTSHIFKNLLLKDDNTETRLPFETAYIRSTLLNSEKLAGLNEQAKWVLYAFAETGAGLNELTGLLPEDINLDAAIPHIVIQPRKGRSLKTKYRKRVIPLVGFALDAFKACPKGFTVYHDRPDSLSGLISKYLREHNLMPTRKHTVYSLRHSFQDRLLAVNTPDRIQADLMGHKFNRPRYGEGATLQHKLEWMKKVQLKPE